MQIFGPPWLLPNGTQTVCPRNLSDNGGCDKGPRTITTRGSADGVRWEGWQGCLEPPPHAPPDPSTRATCTRWNYSGVIKPNWELGEYVGGDPPEMEFYRMRPFYVGDSGRGRVCH